MGMTMKMKRSINSLPNQSKCNYRPRYTKEAVIERDVLPNELDSCSYYYLLVWLLVDVWKLEASALI